MFCPFLSAGKTAPVDCDPNCALYNGSVDGKTKKECVLYTIGCLVCKNDVRLQDLADTVEEIAGGLVEVKASLRDLADK